MGRIVCSFIILSSFFCAYPVNSQIDSIRFFRDTLPNGLKVFVYPDSSYQHISTALLFHAGAKFDRADQAGVAYLSHQLLTGTAFDRSIHFGESPITDLDGSISQQYLNKDVSVYQQWGSPALLDNFLKNDANRLLAKNFTNERINDWRDAIVNEAAIHDRPLADFEFQFRAKIYAPAMVRPVKGFPDYLESSTLDEIKSFIQKNYSSDRANLFVAGKVQPDSVFKMVRQYFGFWRPNQNSLFKTGAHLDSIYRKEFAVMLPDTYDQECLLHAHYLNNFSDSTHLNFHQVATVAQLLFAPEEGLFQKMLNPNHQLLLKSGLEIDTLAEGGYIKVYMFPRSSIPLDSLQSLVDTFYTRIIRDTSTQLSLKTIQFPQQKSFMDVFRSPEAMVNKMVQSFIQYGDCKKGILEEWKACNLSADEVRKIIKLYFQSRDFLTIQLLAPGG